MHQIELYQTWVFISDSMCQLNIQCDYRLKQNNFQKIQIIQ